VPPSIFAGFRADSRKTHSTLLRLLRTSFPLACLLSQIRGAA